MLSDAAPGVRQQLASIGVERDAITAAVEAGRPVGDVAPTGHIPFTPLAKEVLTYAADSASGPVEPRHIARGVVHVADGLAAELMRDHAHLDQDDLVAAVDRVLVDTEGDVLFATAPTAAGLLRCSFCDQGEAQVQKLIAGPGVYICDECVALCNRIIGEHIGPEGSPETKRDTTETKRVAARIDELAAELEQLRRDLEGET